MPILTLPPGVQAIYLNISIEEQVGARCRTNTPWQLTSHASHQDRGGVHQTSTHVM